MTPADLAMAGEALYGLRWHAELARQLGITYRTLRRWMTGEYPVPAGVAGEVRALLAGAEARLAAAQATLAGASPAESR